MSYSSNRPDGRGGGGGRPGYPGRPGSGGGYPGRPGRPGYGFPGRPGYGWGFPKRRFPIRRRFPMRRPMFRGRGRGYGYGYGYGYGMRNNGAICRIVRQMIMGNPGLADQIQEILMRHGIFCPGLPMGGFGGRGRGDHGGMGFGNKAMKSNYAGCSCG